MLNLVAAAVASATTDVIFTLSVREAVDVAIEVKNAGANALDAFVVQGRASDTGAWFTLLTASGDYTTPKYPLQRVTTDPTSLAGGSSTLLLLKAAGLTDIRVQMSSAVGATTVDVHAHAT